jgi:hypothetical protein
MNPVAMRRLQGTKGQSAEKGNPGPGISKALTKEMQSTSDVSHHTRILRGTLTIHAA